MGPRSKLSRSQGHRRALSRNLIKALFRHERIRTTKAKARSIQAEAEKLITKGKRGDLHARRQVAAVLTDPEITRKVFEELAPRYMDRPGGYTRILKLGPRLGDGAEMVIMELV
ncbi:MAG: 50S ribosomal protein L17 [Chloroflexota bacterium]|nr:50S ribosomal protein L17 [Chloroflexota bacterium]